MRVPKVREIPVVLRSCILAAIVPVMVKALPLPRVLSLLEPRKRVQSSCDPYELARIVSAAVRLGPRFGVGECLVRSLVLYNSLRRAAYAPLLVIGGRLSDDRFEGHCWIEIDGKPLAEPNDPGDIARIFAHSGSR